MTRITSGRSVGRSNRTFRLGWSVDWARSNGKWNIFSFQLAQYLLLINKLEYVRCIEEDVGRTDDCDREKYVQLKPVDHESHILPVVAHLKLRKKENQIKTLERWKAKMVDEDG